MKRQQIINELIKKNNYNSYLEIGVQNPYSCFSKINCSYKQGVEPFPKLKEFTYTPNIHIKTSDEYFESNDENFDIVFIDGLHHDDQVIKDIENSLNVLNEGGTIVVHDCLPSTEREQERNDHGGVWLGDVWKGIAHLRINRDDIKIEVVDTDLGCGIITKTKSTKWNTNGELWDNYSYYSNNKKGLMNVISIQEFINEYLSTQTQPLTKYSAIVPTMLKSPRFFKLVDDLIKSEYVDEVIVIDNSGKTQPSIEPHNKLKYVCEGRNTGCNPAWNKGVELSKNELLVIVNDDVNFDPIILSVLTDRVIEQNGIVGMGVGNWDGYRGVPFTHNGNPYLEEWKPGVNDAGWASLFMLKKSQWIPIPEDLIVWYGDNFIKDVNPVKKSILRGFKCETDMSTTTDLPELDEIKKQDLKNWRIHFANRNKWRH